MSMSMISKVKLLKLTYQIIQKELMKVGILQTTLQNFTIKQLYLDLMLVKKMEDIHISQWMLV